MKTTLLLLLSPVIFIMSVNVWVPSVPTRKLIRNLSLPSILACMQQNVGQMFLGIRKQTKNMLFGLNIELIFKYNCY